MSCVYLVRVFLGVFVFVFTVVVVVVPVSFVFFVLSLLFFPSFFLFLFFRLSDFFFCI